MHRILLVGAVLAVCAAVASAVGIPVSGVTVTSDDPTSPYSQSAELSTITAAGDTFTELIAPSAVASSGSPAAHIVYWGSDDPAPAKTLGAVLLDADITDGVLNPTLTGSGVINLIFPHHVGNDNGAKPDLFLFNIDNAASPESWEVTAIIGGTAGAPILAPAGPTTFVGTDMGHSGVSVTFSSNGGHTGVTQGNWGIGLDLANDLGVNCLTGLRINTAGGDPSAVVGVPDKNLLVNGDFETNHPDHDFPLNWSGAATAIEHRGLTATGLDSQGTKAAYMLEGGGGMYQRPEVGPQWQLDLLFAGEGEQSAGRSLNLLIRHIAGTGNQINLRVTPNGDLQVYNNVAGDTTGWKTLASAIVSLSVDENGDNDFEDLDDLLNVYSLRIVGDYLGLSPSYDVYLSAANSPTLALIGQDISYFQTSKPTPGTGPAELNFQTSLSDADYVVDQVRLVNVPEPATLSLLALGALGLLARRRRGR